MSGIGIAACGAYVPPLRVKREQIASAHAWVNPSLRSLARGERSTAGWDEDAITMAVDAARQCLRGVDRGAVGRVLLGTTTAPFAERLNSGVVASALGLREDAIALDLGGSRRAGTSTLLAGADAVAARGEAVLCIASEKRRTQGASAAEMTTGHAAASLLLAPGDGVARLLGSATLHADFVDQYRAAGSDFDHGWEERWVRDAGWLRILPRAVAAVLAQCGLNASAVDRFCVPSPLPRLDRALAKACGIPEAALVDQLADGCGDSGTAHPLLLLCDALEQAGPGERILMAGFGQGADALLFETTGASPHTHTTVRSQLARRLECTYPRYATLSGLLTVDRGIRAEVDRVTAQSAAWRHSDLTLGLVGGRCRQCDAAQIPRSAICANPECRAVDTQQPHSFADSPARVVTWSADSLTYTPDPPAYYGMVGFAEGGRLTVDFTDVGPDGVDVGTPMRMVFRAKDHDSMRGFTRYFWKAAPEPQEA